MKSLIIKDVFISINSINYISNGAILYSDKKVFYFDVYFIGGCFKRFSFDSKEERDYELERLYKAFNES